MHDDVSTRLREILEEDLAVDVEKLEPSSELVADLGLDSLAFAIAIVAIEEKMGIRLSEDSLRTCETVADVETLVARTHGDGDGPDGLAQDDSRPAT